MKCPKCDSNFQPVVYQDIEVDRCSNCHGLWFDMSKKESLQGIYGSQSIDVGEKEVGEEHNKNRKIDCPKCSAAMMGMIDKDQFHIQYEFCPSCYGTFFDAGEFRDLKEHTFRERFKQMVATVKSNLKNK